jgi:hypothetical protein
MGVEPKRDILLRPLLRAGVRRCWAARDHLLRLGVVPVAALVAILAPLERAMEAAAPKVGATEVADPSAASAVMLFGLCYYAAMTVFAVNWLRQLTLGSTAVPGLGLNLATRHLRFLLLVLASAFLTGILAVILMLVLGSIGFAGILTALLLSLLVWGALMVRISPSWIGIAIDARMPLAIAWRRTAGQGFKLLVALLAIQVPLMFAQLAVSVFFQATGLEVAAPLTFILLTAVLQLIGTATQLSIMVTAFPHFLRETV